jgi:hypothetical protein
MMKCCLETETGIDGTCSRIEKLMLLIGNDRQQHHEVYYILLPLMFSALDHLSVTEF